ncbi:MAG TPA: NUDIX domain-containing protein [Acidimicrobiales bacterium]|nr:NUDIX domain-containing protein [Acidimicrobiales bacterium]
MAGELRLRRGVRAVVLDDHDRVLLVHFEFARPPHEVAELWATPGGGVEDGEDDRGALARELAEEVGLHNPGIGPMIWTRTHVAPMSTGHDGQRENFYLVRTPTFEARPALTIAQLRAENVAGLAWWTIDELTAADAVFAPRRLPTLVAALVADGPSPLAVDTGV